MQLFGNVNWGQTIKNDVRNYEDLFLNLKLLYDVRNSSILLSSRTLQKTKTGFENYKMLSSDAITDNNIQSIIESFSTLKWQRIRSLGWMNVSWPCFVEVSKDIPFCWENITEQPSLPISTQRSKSRFSFLNFLRTICPKAFPGEEWYFPPAAHVVFVIWAASSEIISSFKSVVTILTSWNSSMKPIKYFLISRES